MSFKFLNPSEVFNNKTWIDECTHNPGGPAGVIHQNTIVSAFEAELNFQRARMWAKSKTRTGYWLFEEVRKSPVQINVVAWRSTNPLNPGFSMFSNDSPLPGQGTIYVNLEQLVSVDRPNPEDAKKNLMLNNFVLILHEIGHAKQFIDAPAWFRSNEGTGKYNEHYKKVVMDAVKNKTGKAWGIEGTVDRIMGNAHKAFSSAIEWENYLYHEGPICDEVGIARRISYSNLQSHFGTTFMSGKHNAT